MRRKMTRKPTHPGEMIKESYMKPLGLSITVLAGKLLVSRKTLSTIINERAGATLLGNLHHLEVSLNDKETYGIELLLNAIGEEVYHE